MGIEPPKCVFNNHKFGSNHETWEFFHPWYVTGSHENQPEQGYDGYSMDILLR